VRVLIPPPLHSYTNGRSVVAGRGATLSELLDALDDDFPGIRFRVIDEQDRIRPHIRFFVNAKLAASVGQQVAPADQVQIICALSGG